MTFEEAVALAENGDIGAMISLGDYYIHHEDEAERFEKAAEWYEMAAKRDVVYAIHMTILCKKITTEAGLMIAKKVEYGVDFALREFESLYEWTAKELECINKQLPGTEDLKIEDSIKNFEEASYHLALCCYWVGRYDEAKELIRGFEDVRSRILYGATLVQLAEDNAAMAEALKYLEALTDRQYVDAPKFELEEDAYAVAAVQVSRLYKIKGSPADMEAAVSLLNFMSQAVCRDENKQKICDERNRYQKKLFGGYKYV